MNSTTDIYFESCKTFWTTFGNTFALTFGRGSLFLPIWLVWPFCETYLIARKSVFWWNFQWNLGSEHLALTAWKRYYSTVCTASVHYVCTGWGLQCMFTWDSEYLITWQLDFISLLFMYIYIYIYIYEITKKMCPPGICLFVC